MSFDISKINQKHRDVIKSICNPISNVYKTLDYSKLNRQLDLLNDWKEKEGLGTIEATTGFGKTMLAIIAILRMNNSSPSYTTIVVVPNSNLYEDWCDPLIGYIRLFNLKNVRVFVVNSYTMNDRMYKCHLLILDEVHRYTNEDSEYFSTTLNITDYKYCMCLSATLDSDKRKFLEKYNLPIVGKITLAEAERNSWVSKSLIFNLSVELTSEDIPDFTKYNKRINKLMSCFDGDYELARACMSGENKKTKVRSLNLTLSGRGWREYVARSNGFNPVYDTKDHPFSPFNIKGKAFQLNWVTNKRKEFLYNAKNKYQTCLDVIKHLNYPKTIIFSETVEFATNLNKLLSNNGISSDEYHGQISSRVYHDHKVFATKTDKGYIDIHGKTYNTIYTLKKAYKGKLLELYSNKKLKKKIITDYNDDKINVLCTVKSLDEGFDSKKVGLAIIASGTSTPLRQIQRIGRAIRYVEGKTAYIVNLYVDDYEKEKGTVVKSQDLKWLISRQRGIPNSKINWVSNVKEINEKTANFKVVTL